MTLPNIVLLHSHNTGRHIEPYGYAMPTPRLQKLAEEGVLFRRAFAGAPTCSPGRSCVMTGQYPHTNGMKGLAHRGFYLYDYQHTLIQHFNKSGYQTVRAGLQHIAPPDAQSPDGHNPSPEGLAKLGYSQTLPSKSEKGKDVAKVANDFLNTYSDDKPFLLDCGIYETHIPFPEPTSEDNPNYVQPPSPLPDTEKVRRDVAGLRASARNMDSAFGEILDALDKNNLRENTIVVCFTDHGLQFPLGMCNLTDQGLETFFIMRGPKGFTDGKVCEQLISHVDIFPTLCKAANIDIPEWVQGKSFLPDDQENFPKINEQIFGEVNYHAAYEPQRCVRTDRYKYIRRYDKRDSIVKPNADETLSREYLLENGWEDQPRWQEALFDLVFDPHEQNNLLDKPRAKEVLHDMRARLDKWMVDTKDPLLTGAVPAPANARINDADGFSPLDKPK